MLIFPLLVSDTSAPAMRLYRGADGLGFPLFLCEVTGAVQTGEILIGKSREKGQLDGSKEPQEDESALTESSLDGPLSDSTLHLMWHARVATRTRRVSLSDPMN